MYTRVLHLKCLYVAEANCEKSTVYTSIIAECLSFLVSMYDIVAMYEFNVCMSVTLCNAITLHVCA